MVGERCWQLQIETGGKDVGSMQFIFVKLNIVTF